MTSKAPAATPAPTTVNNFDHGTFPINITVNEIAKTMAAVEKLSFKINPQITITGSKTGQKPPFHLSKRSFFFTNKRER